MKSAKLTLHSYSHFFTVSCKTKLLMLLLTICSAAGLGQSYDTILWGANAASQPFAVNEAQGRVVNGKLYTFGGFDSQKSPNFTPTKRSYVYNPVANTWTAILGLPYTPTGSSFGGVTHAGIATDGTNIYFAGGYTSNAAGNGQVFGTNQVWRYNVAANTYTKLTNLPYATSAAQMEYLDGKLHLIGGTDPTREEDLGDHLVLDLNNLAAGWSTLAPLPNPRHHGGSAVLGGKIYFIGGQHEHDGALTTQNDVHVYDPTSNSWSQLADLPSNPGTNGRGHITSSTIVVDGRILVFGGETSNSVRTDMISSYNPATNTWTNLNPLPGIRYAGIAAYMNGYLYYTGGQSTGITFKGFPVIAANRTVVAPAADAFTRNGASAAINYGTNDSLSIKTYNSKVDYSRATYLKFPVNSNNVLLAKLRVYGKNLENTNTITLAVHSVTNDTWTETGINWNNAPAPVTSLARLAINNTQQYYEVDVTNYVKAQGEGDQIASFVIRDTANKNTVIRFNSKENAANAPQLVLYTYSPIITTPQLLSFSTDSLKYAILENATAASQNITLSASTGSPAVSLSKSSNSDWLVLPSGGLGALSFAINSTGLPAGVYNSIVTASSNGYSPATFAVKLEITAEVKTLSFSVDSLHYAAPETGNVTSQNATLNASSGTPAVSLSKSANSDWLVLPADGSGSLSFSINNSTLAPGTYTSTVTASAPNYTPANLVIEFIVSAVPKVLSFTKDSLRYAALENEAAPADSATLNSTFGVPDISLTKSANSDWLILPANGLGSLVFNVNSAGLVPGTYLATVTATATDYTPASIEVKYVVGAISKILSFTKDSLRYAALENEAAPADSATLNSTFGVPDISLTKSANSDWLILPANGLGSLVFNVNGAGLAPGTYLATVTATATDYTPASIEVKYVVGAISKILSFTKDSLLYTVITDGTVLADSAALLSSYQTPDITLTKSANSDWLVLPANGLGSLGFNVNTAGLVAGTYLSTVTASATNYSDAVIVVKLVITPKILSFTPSALHFSMLENSSDNQGATLTANSGSPAITLVKSAGSDWLTLPTGALDLLSFGVNTSGLALGNYSATVTASSPDYMDASMMVTVEVTTSSRVLSFGTDSLRYSIIQNGTASPQSITLSSNTGTPSVSLAKSANSDWLILPSNALGSLDFSINSNGLTPGTYFSTVTATATDYTQAVFNVKLVVNNLSGNKVLGATADAFVRNGTYAAINYGTDTLLWVKTYNTKTGFSRTSYLKFDLTSVPYVSSATLRVFGKNLETTATMNMSVYGVDNDAWTENGITWNNAPTASTASLDTSNINNVEKYYDLDVTSYIKAQLAGDKTATLMLRDPSNQNLVLGFHSREHLNNQTQLVIDTVPPPALSFSLDSLNYAAIQNENVTNQSASLTANTGSPAVTLTKSANSDWLVLPSAGLGALSFGINTVGLTAGTYLSVVKAAAAAYDGDSIVVKLVLTSDSKVLSFAPGNLDYTVLKNSTVSAQSATLNSNNGNPGITLTKTGSGSWLALPSGTLGSLSFSINSTGLQAGAYYDTVIASSATYTSAKLSIKLIVHDSSTTSTLSAVADSYIRNGTYAAINYGTDTLLWVKTYNTKTGFSRSSYLKFNLDVPSVYSAKLRVYGKNLETTATLNMSVFGVDNDTWTENGITWNNAPAATTAALSAVNVNDVEKYYELDVTSYIQAQFAGDKVATLLLKDAVNQNIVVGFHSKENANNPAQLVIETQPPASLSFNDDTLAYSIIQNGTAAPQSITLSASSSTPAVTLSKSANSNWLVLPSAPSLGALSFEINSSGLPFGTYRSTVTATALNYLPASFLVQMVISPDASVKTIIFERLLDSAEVPQGETSSLLEYIAASDSIPASVQLSALGEDGHVPTWLSVNGVLLTGINYTAGSEITFNFDATNLSVGTYTAKVIATSAGYNSGALDIVLVVKSGSTGVLTDIKVNFQDASVSTVPPTGWIRDFGQPFGPRTSTNQGTNNIYGWIRRTDGTPVDLSLNGRKRATPSDDLLLATLMHVQGNDVANFTGTKVEGIWEAQVANGVYDVTVSVGDGTEVNSSHSINVEGTPAIINFVPTTINRFKSATVSVSVADGLLTIDAIGGQNTKINYLIIKPTTTRRPSVVVLNPENGSLNVSENTSISTSILNLPNGGINNDSITVTSVYLTELGNDSIHIPANVNGTGGGDAITLVPAAPLKLSTTYVFHITDGVKDLSGASFIPYSSTFTTGATSTSEILNVKFNKVILANTVGRHSSLIVGPDGKLYAMSIDGIIKRFVINPDGTLQNPQLIYSLQDAYGARTPRLGIGLAFAPNSTASNLIVYVTHSTYVFLNGPDWNGKLTRLSGPNLENVQDVLINLPRSAKDHLTNSVAFGPDGNLYFTQGSNSAMGRADATWGNRDEHLLNGAVLKVDMTKLASVTLPLNVKTAEGGGPYNPYAVNAPVTIYASGVRNAFDLVWHTNGELYVPTNGSAAGGNTPASVNGAPRTDGTTYNGPVIPALTNVQQTQKDFLFRVKQGGYYGAPNPLRGEFVMNGGNPTAAIDPAQVNPYPIGILPDVNYRGFAFDFQTNKSPNGAIEYKSNSFGGALKGKLMVVRYSQNDDIITLTPGGPNKDIVSYNEGVSIQGFSGFIDPLDLTEDVSNGNIYVSEYGGDGQITLLRPTVPPTVTVGVINVSPLTRIYDNQPIANGASVKHPIKIKNTGAGPLTISSVTLTGGQASQYVLTQLPSFPVFIAAADSITINVAFDPTTVGVKAATLNITSNDSAHSVISISMRGLGTAGIGSTNEPSLQAILNLYQIPINVGDDDSLTNVINSNTTQQKAALLGEEVSLQKFSKADTTQPVTIQPLAVFGPTDSNPIVGVGWYISGNAASKQELFTVQLDTLINAQSVNVKYTGTLTFNPDNSNFGFYSRWPFFANRHLYSEDSLNTFSNAIPHHVRVYPYKDSTGVVNNAYLVAFEEHISGFDYQDMVFIVRNVKFGAAVVTVAMGPVEDALTRGGNFTTINYGTDTSLVVKTNTSNASFSRNTYLKFVLGGINNVTSAKLRIYGKNTDNNVLTLLSLFPLSTDSWNEQTITFTNAPAVTSPAITTFSVDSVARYYELDVTSYVKSKFNANRIASFVINDPSNQNRTITFNSRENPVNPPQLIVTTAGVPAKSSASLFVENLDKFPSNDLFVAARIHFKWTRDTVPPFRYNSNHDTVKVRIHNKGQNNLVIKNFVRSNNINWKYLTVNGLAYDSATAFPLTILPGTSIDVRLQFVQTIDYNVRIRFYNDNFSIWSNDDKQPIKTVNLNGVWQRSGEGNNEPKAQEMLTVFGFKTKTGFVAGDPDDGNPRIPKGDEILSTYFLRADASRPITVMQMTAYHGCCTATESLRWYPKTSGSPSLSSIVTHITEDGQSFLPRKGATKVPADGSFTPATPTTAFGFRVGANDWTDTLRTPSRKIGVRVWKAIDGNGRIIPNEYILANDYLGSDFTNYDYNDNLYYVRNIRPELGTSYFSNLAATPSAVDFGEMTTGSGGSFAVTLKSLGQTYANGSSDPQVTITSVEIRGENQSEFSTSVPVLTTLNPQQTTTLNVNFNPTSQGLKIADLLVYYNNSKAPLRVPLYGIAKGAGVTVVVNKRIKSGSTSAVTINGKTWSAETGFAFDNLEPYTNTAVTAIDGTDDDALYTREQSSNADKKPFRYEIVVPNGTYHVRLHFAELYWGAPGNGRDGGVGSRVQSITIENELRLANLDVVSEVKTATALVKNFIVTVTDGNLNINWSATVNRPMICAVEVYSFVPAGSPLVLAADETIDNLKGIERTRVYPNPLRNKFYVQVPTVYEGRMEFQLTDLTGSVFELGAFNKRSGGSVQEVDISKLALRPGMYFLKIRYDKEKSEIIKLIVQ